MAKKQKSEDSHPHMLPYDALRSRRGDLGMLTTTQVHLTEALKLLLGDLLVTIVAVDCHEDILEIAHRRIVLREAIQAFVQRGCASRIRIPGLGTAPTCSPSSSRTSLWLRSPSSSSWRVSNPFPFMSINRKASATGAVVVRMSTLRTRCWISPTCAGPSSHKPNSDAAVCGQLSDGTRVGISCAHSCAHAWGSVLVDNGGRKTVLRAPSGHELDDGDDDGECGNAATAEEEASHLKEGDLVRRALVLGTLAWAVEAIVEPLPSQLSQKDSHVDRHRQARVPSGGSSVVKEAVRGVRRCAEAVRGRSVWQSHASNRATLTSAYFGDRISFTIAVSSCSPNWAGSAASSTYPNWKGTGAKSRLETWEMLAQPPLSRNSRKLITSETIASTVPSSTAFAQ
eukprot:2054680-Prymnesium_polylepis.1